MHILGLLRSKCYEVRYCTWSSSNFLYCSRESMVNDMFSSDRLCMRWLSLTRSNPCEPHGVGIVAFNPQFEIWTIGELYALRGFNWCIRGSWNSGELLVSKLLFNLSRAQRDTSLISRFIADSRGWNDSWGLYKPINALHWSLIRITTKQNIQEPTIKGPLSIPILENQTIFTISKCSHLNSSSTSLLRPWLCEFF
jgi:hypothetical protein